MCDDVRACGASTDHGGAERVASGGEEDGLVRGWRRRVHGAPGNAVRRAACHLADLGALEALHQRRLAVDGRRAVALLSVVVVAPRVHLTTTNQQTFNTGSIVNSLCAICILHESTTACEVSNSTQTCPVSVTARQCSAPTATCTIFLPLRASTICGLRTCASLP